MTPEILSFLCDLMLPVAAVFLYFFWNWRMSREVDRATRRCARVIAEVHKVQMSVLKHRPPEPVPEEPPWARPVPLPEPPMDRAAPTPLRLSWWKRLTLWSRIPTSIVVRDRNKKR